MTARRPLPLDLRHPFTTAEARERGVSEGRLRAADLDAPFRGVRVPRRTPPLVDDAPLAHDRAERRRVGDLIEAYAPLMAPRAFIGGRSALIWHGVSVLHGDDLDIAVPAPERAPRRIGIRSRSISQHLVHVHTSLGGLRIATPASAWAMLADELDVRDLVRAADQIVRVPRDSFGAPRPELQLATPEQLRSAMEAGRRPGVGRLRMAMDRVRVGSMSPLETDVRLDIVDAGLPEPALDVEIRDRSGRLLGIADGAYRAYRVLLEIEGDHHRTSGAQWTRDIEKHAAYVADGWEVIRLTAAHIRGARPSAVGRVRDALRRHGAPLPP